MKCLGPTVCRMNTSQQPRLGVDIGRVIIHGDGPDTSFIGGSEEQAMRAPPMDGAFAALARLCTTFERRVWLVSKCGERIAQRSRRWLAQRGFFQATGIPEDNLVFCRERTMKAPICRDLAIGWFVDDRVDVLVPMDGMVRHRFLFGSATSNVPGIVPVPTWVDAEAAILATVADLL